MEQHRRSRIPGKIDPDAWRYINTLISYSTASAATVNVPASVVDGDLMVMSYSTRNCTITAPAGWTWAASGDSSGGEVSAIYYRIASSEPANYTWTLSGGYAAFLCAAYRGPKELTLARWIVNYEAAPSVIGLKQGLLVAVCGTAASSTNLTEFTGMTTVYAHYNGGNARVLQAYMNLTEDAWTDTYPMNPTGLAYDGYSAASFI